MKQMTHNLRRKIAMMIKNRIDISKVIEDVDISNMDLSYAIIGDFNRANDSIIRVKFKDAIIGEKEKLTNLSRNRFVDCSFENARFVGKTFIRHSRFFNCDFANAWMPYVEAQFAEFDDRCNFCETYLRLGVDYLHKAKFGVNLFRDLLKHTNLKVVEKGKEER